MIGGVEAVEVLPVAEVDRYGSPVPGTGDPVTVPDVVVSPGPAPESTSRDRDGVTVDLTLYAPTGTAIDRASRVVVRGHEYDVVGEPQVFTGGLLAGGQVVLEVRRAEG